MLRTDYLSCICTASAALVLVAAGCNGGPPAYRLGPQEQAALQPGAECGPAELRILITLLDSDDLTLRLRAIERLRDATGETLGYDAFGSVAARRAAVRRWVEWCNVHAPQQEES